MTARDPHTPEDDVLWFGLLGDLLSGYLLPGALRLENHPEVGWRRQELFARISAAVDRAGKRQVEQAKREGNAEEAGRVATAYLVAYGWATR